jgi:hypothetical protein
MQWYAIPTPYFIKLKKVKTLKCLNEHVLMYLKLLLYHFLFLIFLKGICWFLMMFFWVWAPCGLAGRSQRFEEAYCLDLQG